MRAALGGALAILLAGCGIGSTTGSGISVPTGPQLNEFTLTERCQAAGDSSCTDRALEIASELLRRLGPPMPPEDDRPAVPEVRVPFTISVDHDPPFEWDSADGTRGTTAGARIDLEPFLAGRGPAIVRIDATELTYPAPDDVSQLLVDALFLRGG